MKTSTSDIRAGGDHKHLLNEVIRSRRHSSERCGERLVYAQRQQEIYERRCLYRAASAMLRDRMAAREAAARYMAIRRHCRL